MTAPEPQVDSTTFWQVINPANLFRCRPSDFQNCPPSICPGIFWMPGILGLVAVHAFTTYAVYYTWDYGFECSLATLVPVAALWLLFVPADIKFRLQKPTKLERGGFDNAVINWFGMIFTIAELIFILPAAVVGSISWLVF